MRTTDIVQCIFYDLANYCFYMKCSSPETEVKWLVSLLYNRRYWHEFWHMLASPKVLHSITTSLSCHPEVGSTVSTGPLIVNRGGIKGCFKPPKTFINKVKTSLLMNECLFIAFYKIEFDIACYSAPYKVLAILFYFCFNELKLWKLIWSHRPL